MLFLLSCVETFKEIEIFVKQYCINCKGIEKEIFWPMLIGFRIFRTIIERLSFYGADHYFFGSWRLKIFQEKHFFFLHCCLWKHFFPVVSSCKQFIWAFFFAFANKFFAIVVSNSLVLRVSDWIIRAGVRRRGSADLHHIYVAYRSYPTSNFVDWLHCLRDQTTPPPPPPPPKKKKKKKKNCLNGVTKVVILGQL